MTGVEIIDGCSIFVDGLREVLFRHGIDVVSAGGTAPESPHPQARVVVIDPEVFRGRDDAQPIGRIARLRPVVVLTAERLSGRAPSYLRVGVCDVVSKQERPEAIVAAILGCLRWEEGAPEPESEAHAGDEARVREQAQLLSPRETEVLRQISWGLTHDQVARRLGISRHTVDTYVKRIRFKLGVGNKAELTRAAIVGQLTSS